MAGENQILKFAQDATNILGQVAYDGDTDRSVGVSGVARSALQNKFQRQMSTIAAGIAQFIADYNSAEDDVTDILTANQIEALFLDALSSAPLTTQPQFNNSQKAATTEFVQRALGNLAGSSQYAVNTILTASDVGKIVSPTAGGLGFDLPLVSGMPNGAKIIFNGNGHGCVVSRQGSDVINDGNLGPISVISVNNNDMLEVTVINGVWTVTGGNEQLNTSSQFQHIATGSGYIKLPGGIILQWLPGSINANTSGVQNTFSLPLAWPNGLLNAQVNFSGSNPPIGVSMSVDAGSNPLTQLTVEAKTQTGTASGLGVYCFAIGH